MSCELLLLGPGNGLFRMIALRPVLGVLNQSGSRPLLPRPTGGLPPQSLGWTLSRMSEKNKC